MHYLIPKELLDKVIEDLAFRNAISDKEMIFKLEHLEEVKEVDKGEDLKYNVHDIS